MEARPLVQDAVRKPIPTIKASQCQPLSFSYESAPSGVDSNLLILLHGLGDTHLPFKSLGRKLATNLPQTAVLSLRGGSTVPFLDDQGYGWWDVWDGQGQEISQPNPSAFLQSFRNLLDYLTKEASQGGCGWPASSIHLFGFAQGGTAALEGAIAWSRQQVSNVKIQVISSEPQTSSRKELGSIVSICGSVLSHPTFSPPLQAPVLYFHRQDKASADAKSRLASLKKGFANVQEAIFVSLQPESMPQSQPEWTAIMKFWSSVVRNRSNWELNGEVYSMGSQEQATKIAPTPSAGWSPTAEEKGR